MSLSESDLADLKRAHELLETPGLTAKITSALGTPIEKGFELMPTKWREAVHKASEAALMKALAVAVRSLGDQPERSSSDRIHKIAAAASGAVGGAFGLPALAVELPVSTTIMLRSIADIARSEGEDPQTVETKLACLTVFALGGKSSSDDAAESGYFAVRAGLATAVTEAARYLAEKGVGAGGAPALVRLISMLAARFGVVVSEKAAAQAVPILGAAGGAMINTLFIGHFQDMARGHFIVRRLEQVYGVEVVKRAYERI
jgi:EcsC protein family